MSTINCGFKEIEELEKPDHNMKDENGQKYEFDNPGFIPDTNATLAVPHEVHVQILNDEPDKIPTTSEEQKTTDEMLKEDSFDSSQSAANMSRSSSADHLASSCSSGITSNAKPTTTAKFQGILKNGKKLEEMTPDTKKRMQNLLHTNAGVLKQDSSTLMLGVYNLIPDHKMSSKELDKRFSSVAMEMLREREDRDLHPYGRGGRYEGVLYSRRVKVQLDHSKFLAWIIFAGFILIISGAIIFLAEMERRQKSKAATIESSLTNPVTTLPPAL